MSDTPRTDVRSGTPRGPHAWTLTDTAPSAAAKCANMALVETMANPGNARRMDGARSGAATGKKALKQESAERDKMSDAPTNALELRVTREARSSPSPGSANQERRVRTEAERAEEREDLAYEMFSHIMGDVPWDCHVVILRSIYTELADYILTRFDRKPGVGLVEQSPDSEPRGAPKQSGAGGEREETTTL